MRCFKYTRLKRLGICRTSRSSQPAEPQEAEVEQTKTIVLAPMITLLLIAFVVANSTNIGRPEVRNHNYT